MDGAAPFWFGVVEDITERKRAEEELRLQIEVLQNIPAVAWTVTPDGVCDFINQFSDFLIPIRAVATSAHLWPAAHWNCSATRSALFTY